MDIRYLETVLAVAKYQSFSVAAEEIPCSQGSVSRQVSDVEKALGYKVFHRSTKAGDFSLTDQGRIALPQIERIVEEYRVMFGNPNNPTFRLGIPAGLINFKAKQLITTFVYERCPEINLMLVDLNRSAWLRALTANQIDGMFMHHVVDNIIGDSDVALFHDNELCYTNLCSQKQSIAFPKDHPMAERISVSLTELMDETFLFCRYMEGFSDINTDEMAKGFLLECTRAGFQPHMVILNKPGVVFANVRDIAVNENGWIYPTFQFHSWHCNENIRLVPLQTSSMQADFCFVTMATKKTPRSKNIAKCLQELCDLEKGLLTVTAEEKA